MRGVVKSLSKSLITLGALGISFPVISEDFQKPLDMFPRTELSEKSNITPLIDVRSSYRSRTIESSLFNMFNSESDYISRISGGFTVWEGEGFDTRIIPRLEEYNSGHYLGNLGFLEREYNLCLSFDKKGSAIETCMGIRQELSSSNNRLSIENNNVVSLRFSYNF